MSLYVLEEREWGVCMCPYLLERKRERGGGGGGGGKGN